MSPQFANPPERVPAPPVGDYPEDWAKCVNQTDPAAPVLPAGIEPRGVDPSSPNPLLGLRYFVDRMEPAYMDWARYKRQGNDAQANTIWRLAREPRFRWFGKFTRPRMQKKTRGFLDRVQCDQPGTVPMMAVMRHQGKSCNGSYRAGGEAEDRATMGWYDDFAQAVGNARVIIGFEPDSIGTISCLAKGRRQARREMLRYGVDELSKLPNATIYLEGTASDWKSPSYTARMLRYIGIHKVRGFMLNVTHFDWTGNNIAYGRKVSRLVGGKPFVVSTSYNGRGPVHYKARNGKRVNVFCNVRYRGAGPLPNTRTGYDKVDAFLWLNRPGTSGAGSCNGAPRDGEWWLRRGLMYGKYATQRMGPARGTRYGFKRRISLCRLGAPGPGLRYYTSPPERRCR